MVVGLVSVLLALLTDACAPAQVSTIPTPINGNTVSETFPNGHQIRGALREFYHAYGGVDVFGPPITAEHYDANLGVIFQCFENACLGADGSELPLNVTDVRVLPVNVMMGLLEPALGSTAQPGCVFVAESGHHVCLDFLMVWRENQVVLGNPISEYRIENETYVQHFENGTLMWFPEKGLLRKPVLFAAQGMKYAFSRGDYDQISRPPGVMGNPGDVLVIDLEITVLPNPLYSDSDHMVEVQATVLDEHNAPVSGVSLILTVDYGVENDLSPMSYRMGPTNSAGLSQLWVEVSPVASLAAITFTVTASYQGRLTDIDREQVIYLVTGGLTEP